MKTLLVGFAKYAKHAKNPTEDIFPLVKGKDVVKVILPVVYEEVKKLPEIIAKEKPDFIITVNLSPFRKEPAIEEYAYNEMNSVQPDEKGVLKSGEAIVKEGPKSYPSVLDIPSLQVFLSSEGQALAMSIDPGRFVCNEASYLARHSGIPSVSLHVPLQKDFPVEEEAEIIDLIIRYAESIRG